MTETVLFVGGPHDGRVMEINGGEKARIICFPASPAGSDMYRRQIIYTYTEMKEYPVYLYDTESPDNLIPLLIGGYRGKE